MVTLAGSYGFLEKRSWRAKSHARAFRRARFIHSSSSLVVLLSACFSSLLLFLLFLVRICGFLFVRVSRFRRYTILANMPPLRFRNGFDQSVFLFWFRRSWNFWFFPPFVPDGVRFFLSFNDRGVFFLWRSAFFFSTRHRTEKIFEERKIVKMPRVLGGWSTREVNSSIFKMADASVYFSRRRSEWDFFNAG